jgi:hypothetical protein
MEKSGSTCLVYFYFILFIYFFLFFLFFLHINETVRFIFRVKKT